MTLCDEIRAIDYPHTAALTRHIEPSNGTLQKEDSSTPKSSLVFFQAVSVTKGRGSSQVVIHSYELQWNLCLLRLHSDVNSVTQVNIRI